MRRFFLGLWAFTAISHLVFLAAAHEVLSRLGAPSPAVLALGLTAGLVALLGRRLHLLTHDRPISRARRALELLYYTHWCGAVAGSILYLAGGALLLAGSLAARVAGEVVPPVHGALVVASAGAGLALGVYGVWFRARRPRVRRLEIPVRGMDPALDGYTIAQLSDLHIGSLFSKRAAARWIRTANAERPDLVALTGDYVTNGVAFHEDIADTLGALRAADAVVAVLGNHDYFGHGEPLASLLVERGIVLLRNQRHTVRRGEASLEIAGVDDTWTRRADVDRTMRGFGGARPLIALSHDPALFPDFARHGAALVLAGHTHWGQVGVPFAAQRYNLARRVFRFSAGLYREGGSALYVNPGLGTSGPPVRFGSSPEITVFTLRCA
jgi:uncharacterized protein